MSPTRIQTHAIAAFTCLGDQCPDTCCQGWGMQLTRETIDRYERAAPELLDAVTSGEAEYVMKRDPVTDYCVKFDAGWCQIHRDYGADFLGDACHFFPRVTRALGQTVVTTGALSCPEVARLALFTEHGFSLTPRTEIRVPYSLRNYLPPELPEEEALAIHTLLLEAVADETYSAEHQLMRLSTVARALEMQPVAQWREAVPFYLKMAEGRIPAAEPVPSDLFNLAHALYGLVQASPARRARLTGLVERIANALGIQFDPVSHTMTLVADAPERVLALMHHSKTIAPRMQPILRRYLQAQLSQALFPFAGLGKTLSERITIIGVRFATVKLALMTLPEISERETVAIVQTLSRFMDHLADAELSLRMYAETGWIREPRLRSLIGD